MTVNNAEESRFAYLIQPIRDLTKNWDIDIARSLEDYLNEIEHIEITFDDGCTKMNFAEAAILIQGTVGVYSKKVEYLYKLVYQVLDLVANNKKKQKTALEAQGNDLDRSGIEDEDEYASMDNIKEGKNIIMVEGRAQVAILPRIPMALIPLGNEEKGQNPLISYTGEVLASRNDFKMNTCSLHNSGFMLLNLANLDLSSLSISWKQMPGSMQTVTDIQHVIIDEEGQTIQDFTLNDDGGCELFDDIPQNNEGDINNISLVDDQPMPNEVADQIVEQEEIVRRSERVGEREVIADVPRPEFDLFQSLPDPHERENMLYKAFKKGNVCSMATVQGRQIKDKKRKRNNRRTSCTTEDVEIQSLPKFGDKLRKALPKIVTSKELGDLNWEENKERQTFKKLRMGGVQRNNTDQREDNVWTDGNEANDINDDGGDDVPNIDFCQGDMHNELPNVVDDPNFMDDLEQIIQDTAGRSDRELTDVELCVTSSYEDLVRQYTEGFLASAQNYAQVTELSKRVSEWEDKILPKLQEEEEHEPFDIHQYGTAILDGLIKNENEALSFRELVQHKKLYQIPRLFLATLQLANTYNVEIQQMGVLDQGVDKMKLELLSTKRHHEDMQLYQP